MSVLFTSFKHSVDSPGKKFSIVKFQPSGFNYDELLFLAPIGPAGNDLRSRDFFGTGRNFPKDEDYTTAIEAYKMQVKAGYKARWNEIWFWLMSLREHDNIVLCCWCPHSKSAKQHITNTGFFPCHSSIIKSLLIEFRPDISIVEDSDRQLLTPSWR